MLSRRRFGWANSLVVGEVALSLVVLAAAGSFARSLTNLTSQEFGFDREHVLVVDIDPALARYNFDRLGPLYRQVNSRLNSIEGVKSASLSFYSPFNGCCWGFSVAVNGYTAKPDENMVAMLNRVSQGYFETLGTKVRQGRTFDEHDTAGSRRVAVVNEAFVRRFFPDGNAIGQRFGIGGETNRRDLEIAGVVEDVKYRSPSDDEPVPMAFLPLTQVKSKETTTPGEYESSFVHSIEIRTTGNPTAIAGHVRQALAEIDPALVVLGIDTPSGHIDRAVNQETVVAHLAAFFGVLALVLACVGLYGLMAYMVQRRTGEIGIRIALGARRGTVMGMVIPDVLAQAIAGILLGIPAAFAVTHLIANQLYGVSPADPASSAMAALVLTVCITIAGYIPARRASLVDPTVALKHD